MRSRSGHFRADVQYLTKPNQTESMLFGFVEYCKQCCSVLLSIVSYFCKNQNQTISAISNNIDNKIKWKYCFMFYNIKQNQTILNNIKQYWMVLQLLLQYTQYNNTSQYHTIWNNTINNFVVYCLVLFQVLFTVFTIL